MPRGDRYARVLMDQEEYDSTLDTMRHSRRVDELLLQVVVALQQRVTRHDLSKMAPPEKAVFDRITPLLKQSTYGSEEYKASLADMGEVLVHHYGANRHHPEHFQTGISGMTLVDLIEMLCDWKAATERHDDGSLARSLQIQESRFGIEPQLMAVLTNTAVTFGWLPSPAVADVDDQTGAVTWAVELEDTER
jgi:hypothetical protein